MRCADISDMKTLVRISLEADDGTVYDTVYYEREGEWQVQTQITSWMRECAVDYWQRLNDAPETALEDAQREPG